MKFLEPLFWNNTQPLEFWCHYYRLAVCVSKSERLKLNLQCLWHDRQRILFNSFGCFQFCHTFSLESHYVKIVALIEICRFTSKFMPYKTYFWSHSFAYSNLRFLPFCDHLRWIENNVHHVNQLAYIDLMMYIYNFIPKKSHFYSEYYPRC